MQNHIIIPLPDRLPDEKKLSEERWGLSMFAPFCLQLFFFPITFFNHFLNSRRSLYSQHSVSESWIAQPQGLFSRILECITWLFLSFMFVSLQYLCGKRLWLAVNLLHLFTFLTKDCKDWHHNSPQSPYLQSEDFYHTWSFLEQRHFRPWPPSPEPCSSPPCLVWYGEPELLSVIKISLHYGIIWDH